MLLCVCLHFFLCFVYDEVVWRRPFVGCVCAVHDGQMSYMAAKCHLCICSVLRYTAVAVLMSCVSVSSLRRFCRARLIFRAVCVSVCDFVESEIRRM